jgi:hypothetical protein
MLCAGQVYRASLTVWNLDAPPGSVALAITKPGGTLVDPAPSIGAATVAGKDYTYTYDYTLPSAGLFKFAWSTTGPGTTPAPDYVNVRDFISLIGLTEAKAHLNMTATTDDDELLNFMQAATELVESRAGTCVPRQVTGEWITGSVRSLIRLPSGPLPSATSVTSISSTWPGGPTWGPDDLIVNPAAGTVRLKTMVPFWWGPWQATYTAGRTVIPERFLQACKEQLRHLWETQRGPSPSPPLPGEELFTSSAGWSFSVPQRVIELLAGDVITPVMA